MSTASEASRTFHQAIYLQAAIDDAVAAYGGFAQFTVEPTDDAWTVSFSAVDEDFEPETLASEFANFVLAQTIERKRQP